MDFRKFWRKFCRNKGAVVCLFICILIIAVSLLSDVIAPYGYDDQALKNRLKPPSNKHIFGTDEFGRDIFSRVIIGGKTSITIGFASVLIAIITGVPLGMIAGYYDKADILIMRIMDIFMALPGTLLAMAIVATLGPSMFNVMIAVAFFSIPTFARVTRANVLSVKEEEFVLAAKTYGLPNYKILLSHILPNIFHSIIVLSTMRFATSVLTSSSLSFLGLGVQPPTPDWGAMINSGRPYLRTAWWVVTFPSLSLLLLTVSINVLGDALRDALDPKM